MNNECDICHKSFISKRNYNRHINNPNVHIKYQENVKKYICNCGNVYLRNSSLTFHKRKCSVICDDPQLDIDDKTDIDETIEYAKEVAKVYQFKK